MDLGRLVLGSPILCLKGMRIMMFQLSGFYYRKTHFGRKPLVTTALALATLVGRVGGFDSRFWLICGVGLGCTVEAQKLETL